MDLLVFMSCGNTEDQMELVGCLFSFQSNDTEPFLYTHFAAVSLGGCGQAQSSLGRNSIISINSLSTKTTNLYSTKIAFYTVVMG